MVVVKFAGVDSFEAAQALRRCEIQISRDQALPLPQDRYYIFDLLGASVRTDEGTFVGRLVDVITTAANDVYVVKNPAGRELLIPAVRQVVLTIDVDAAEIIVRPPPGLFD
jgi:16S rRNA processing protein RimM